MSTQILDPISAAFGTSAPVPLTARPEVKPEEDAKEITEDYDQARTNLKELILQMMENIPEIISVMQQSQSDKMYSAASSFIKTAADLNVSLSKLSLDVKKKPSVKGAPLKIGDGSTPAQITQNNTNVFVGSTEQFLEMLDKKDKEAIEVEFSEVN